MNSGAFQKINASLQARTWVSHVKSFFLSTGPQRLWNRRFPAPHPAHRSFVDPSGNILPSKLCTGATIRPNIFRLFVFLYLIFLLILLSFLISFYSYLLILLFLSLLILLIFHALFFVFLFFFSYILICLLYYRHAYLLYKYILIPEKLLFEEKDFYVSGKTHIWGVFWVGQAFFDTFGVKINVYTGATILFFSSYLFLFFSYYILPLLILIFLYLNCLLYYRHAY